MIPQAIVQHPVFRRFFTGVAAAVGVVPVVIVYWTVSIGGSGQVRFAKDVDADDPLLARALDAPCAGRSVGGRICDERRSTDWHGPRAARVACG